MAFREGVISKLELADEKMRANGIVDAWFRGSDVHVQSVAGAYNGHLLQSLLEATGYIDAECVELLRRGVHCRWYQLCMQHIIVCRCADVS